MKPLVIAFCLVFANASAYAADPTPPIILPDNPVPPTPQPAPGPATLGADQLYIIRANVPVIVVTSPQGLVKTTTDAGPIKIKGKFTDGNGTYQCRTYTDKQIITLEAVGSGTVEVLVIPTGSTDPSAVIRRTIVVGGVPPVPPTPPTDPLTTTLQNAYSGERDAPSLAVLQAAYKSMASQATAKTNLKTNADAVAWMQGQIAMQPAQIANTRRAIAGELASVLGTSAMAALDLNKFALELAKISNALQGVKP